MKIWLRICLLLLLFAASALFYGYGIYEKALAAGDENTSLFRFGAAESVYARLEHSLRFAKYAGPFANRLERPLALGKMRAEYFSGDYGSFAGGGLGEDDADAAFMRANAAYRMAIYGDSAGKGSFNGKLASVIAAYENILRKFSYDEDAAYNYEYLLRILQKSEDLQDGKKTNNGKGKDSGNGGNPGAKPNGLGKEGRTPADRGQTDKFSPYVPQGNDNRPDNGPAVGKSDAQRKRG